MRNGNRDRSRKKATSAPVDSTSSFTNLAYRSLSNLQDSVLFIALSPGQNDHCLPRVYLNPEIFL
jgi:hypothetical protein